MGSSITADDLLGAPSAPKAPQSITVDDLLAPNFKADPHAGMEHQPRPFAPEAGSFNFGASFKDAMIRDPKTKLYQIAKGMFPNDPKAAERFGMYNGRPVYKDDDGQVRYVSSGLSNFLGGAVGNLPEMVAGTVGSMASSPVIGGTLGVMGARGLKDAAAGVIYDEPQTIGGNMLDIGKQGAIQLGTGLAVKGMLGAVNGGRKIDISPRDLAAAEANRQAMRQSTGVNTDLALASGDRRLLAVRNYLAQQPNATASAIQSADDASAAQFNVATDAVLDKIAAAGPASAQGQRGINAAQGAIDDAMSARDAAVKPYYDAASKAKLPVDIVDDLNADPLIARAARRVTGDPVYQRKLAGAQPDSVGFWQQVKRNLDAGYQTANGSGNKTVAREYADAAAQVNGKLKAASPEYAQATEFYAKQTKDIVEPLQNSVVGVIAKIKDQNAATAAARLFRTENVGPAEIFKARQIISAKDKDAWNALVRQFVASEFTKAQTVTQAALETNVPGKLYQGVWGNDLMRQRMNAALGKNAADSLKGLMDTAEALAKSPIKGSNTQPNMAIDRIVAGRWPTWVKAITSPRQTITDAAERGAAERNSALIWDALQSPAKVRQLKIVLRIPDVYVRSANVASVLGATAANEKTSRALQPGVQWAEEMQ